MWYLLEFSRNFYLQWNTSTHQPQTVFHLAFDFFILLFKLLIYFEVICFRVLQVSTRTKTLEIKYQCRMHYIIHFLNVLYVFFMYQNTCKTVSPSTQVAPLHMLTEGLNLYQAALSSHVLKFNFLDRIHLGKYSSSSMLLSL